MIGNERRFLVSRHVIRYLNEQQTVESLPILLGQVKLRNEPTGIAFWQPRQSNEPPHVSNYASEWKEHYLERHYERFDPVIIRAFDQLEPFEWGLGIKLMSPSKLQQELFEEAARFGIRHAASSCFSATTSRASEAGTPMMNATSSAV
jgi:Autoinducer binding domain